MSNELPSGCSSPTVLVQRHVLPAVEPLSVVQVQERSQAVHLEPLEHQVENREVLGQQPFGGDGGQVQVLSFVEFLDDKVECRGGALVRDIETGPHHNVVEVVEDACLHKHPTDLGVRIQAVLAKRVRAQSVDIVRPLESHRHLVVAGAVRVDGLHDGHASEVLDQHDRHIQWELEESGGCKNALWVHPHVSRPSTASHLGSSVDIEPVGKHPQERRVVHHQRTCRREHLRVRKHSSKVANGMGPGLLVRGRKLLLELPDVKVRGLGRLRQRLVAHENVFHRGHRVGHVLLHKAVERLVDPHRICAEIHEVFVLVVLGVGAPLPWNRFVRTVSNKKSSPSILAEVRENLYTVPNILTFTRLAAAPVVGYLLVNGQTSWALGLFAYSCVTDFVDGYIARRYNLRSRVGSIIDPMADKALMVICTACLAHVGTVPMYLAGLILGRDVLLLAAAMVIRYVSLPAPRTFHRYWDFTLITVEVRPTTVSKINTALQMAYLGGTMLLPLVDLGAPLLEPLVAATTVLSGLSANSWKHSWSTPESWLDSLSNVRDTSISGAPPPAIRARSFTRHRITHSASCNDRSVSSKIWLLAPRHTTETVGWVTFFTPVILMIRDSDDSTSSTRSAVPRRDSTNESTSAIGLQPRLLLMNSISSLSMSLTTRMLSLDRKCSARSLTASLRIDFWISNTLHLAFLIFLQILSKYALSSLRILSICLPIRALSILVGPPALLITFCVKTTPATVSVSSMVPPSFLIKRISFRSTFVACGPTTLSTASTASGPNNDECCDTIFDESDVFAALINASLSSSEIRCDMSSKIWTLRSAARVNDSEMMVGWMPLLSSFSAAPSKAPVITTTDVVPSPASTSWAPERSTNILAAGCNTAMCFKIVCPSFEMITSPRPVLIILSIPFGPNDVRTASATARAARMFALRTSCGFSLFLNTTTNTPVVFHELTPTAQDIVNCAYANWYKLFGKHTFSRTVILPLSEQFIQYLENDDFTIPGQKTTVPAEQDDEWNYTPPDRPDPASRFPELHNQIKLAFDKFKHIAPKLDWSAPQDSVWILPGRTMKCSSPEDLYLLLKSSDYINHDLANAFDESGNAPETFQHHLILREWREINPSVEFRCFVRDRQLVGICQRDLNYYPFLNDLHDTIIEQIAVFFDDVLLPKFGSNSFVFDVYLPKPFTKVYLLDINPFARKTDSLLFSWNELATMKVPEDDVVVRLVTQHNSGRFATKAHSQNHVPRDVLEASIDPSKMVEMMRNWSSAQDSDDSD
ncbi:hypothetical protein OGAPHI_005173 [Ogataea philodendri]|uniref:Cell division cycle protein 123 n=1 Tax=Ogataea philodendri TaxID=1378263 RepID=A0A9P8T394_9ASCO|nr:uncharacterized protein OGAPHI_005173 [Ogataea philodendri]KAH3663770.1 hypothetical protein OGAPHI_005173 [Ogataea philodendri]